MVNEKEKDIKIFVSQRIDLESEIIDNPLYYPVRCGAVYDRRENVSIPGDDTGDNISQKRESFCELTVQYWAWKNIKADYYGLCHYRRYLSFSRKKYNTASDESNNGCVSEEYFSSKFVDKYDLNIDNMREIISKYDVIACTSIKAECSNYEAMCNAPEYHNIDDMKMAIEIINKFYPEMKNVVKEYMDSNKVRLYNCFIMRKEIFQEYSKWLFSILFELEKNINMDLYGIQKFRTPGTIGERLFGIYCLYLSKKKNIKIKESQLVFIKHPEKQIELEPTWGENQVTIVSNFNNKYVNVFSVMMLSVLEYIDENRNYEFIVLSEDITKENKKRLVNMLKNYPNVTIRFFNPFKILNDVDLFINNTAYSKDLYVRIVIPYVLKNYKKILVIDSDIICKTNLANLYDEDLKNFSLGAVKDVVFMGYLNGGVCGTKQYCESYLKLQNPYNYCNTGILVMDCNKIRNKYSLEYLLDHINSHQYRIFEQDELNVLFDGDILFLDFSWNMPTYTNPTIAKCVKMAPLFYFHKYEEARKNPKIIHYASHPKPWWCSESDYGFEFWVVARKSPFYETLLASVAWFQTNMFFVNGKLQESFPRRLANLFLPKGSGRREFAKKFLNKDTMLWKFFKKIYYIKNKV